MGMRVHELHPTLIHAPLALLPSAVVIDSVAALGRDRGLERAGRTLWWSVAAGGLVAGLAGMAASQEVKVEDEHTKDMMLLHGLGNVVIVAGAFGIAAWRARNRPTLLSCALGLGAFAFAAYTGYLGGEMVYSHGVGMKENLEEEELERLSPPLDSRQAPSRLLRDAMHGLGWLLGRGWRVLSGRQHLEPGAYGVEAIEHRREERQSPPPHGGEVRSEQRPQ